MILLFLKSKDIQYFLLFFAVTNSAAMNIFIYINARNTHICTHTCCVDEFLEMKLLKGSANLGS